MEEKLRNRKADGGVLMASVAVGVLVTDLVEVEARAADPLGVAHRPYAVIAGAL